jgi:hypothetical protein
MEFEKLTSGVDYVLVWLLQVEYGARIRGDNEL